MGEIVLTSVPFPLRNFMFQLDNCDNIYLVNSFSFCERKNMFPFFFVQLNKKKYTFFFFLFHAVQKAAVVCVCVYRGDTD